MHRRWKGAAAALISALALAVPAMGANVVADGTPLAADQAWVENGTSYITLRAYSELTPYDLSWRGSYAQLLGDDFTMQAQPGQIYVTANDRALYVEDGVQVIDGKLTLPLRIVAQATGADLSWDSATGTVSLQTKQRGAMAASYNQEDLYWLARVISSESQGEPLLGQIAVGNVVLNRVKSNQFPNSIRDVIFDTKNGVQFEPTSNGTIYNQPTQNALLAAKLCLEGANVVGECMYFFAPSLSQGAWIVQNCSYYTTIGSHRFYQ